MHDENGRESERFPRQPGGFRIPRFLVSANRFYSREVLVGASFSAGEAPKRWEAYRLGPRPR